jgi:hypothetical protein
MLQMIFVLAVVVAGAWAETGEKSLAFGMSNSAKSIEPTSRELTPMESRRNSYVLLEHLPKTFAEVAKILPSLKVKKEEKVKNTHVENLVDTIIYATFPGGNVDFFRGAEASPPESIIRLRLIKNVSELKIEPSVGAPRKEVEAAFGVKTKSSKKFELCEIQEASADDQELGQACVEFLFKGDTVKEILWELPID